MNALRLIRSLTGLVLIELLIVAVLAAAAWWSWQSRPARAPSQPPVVAAGPPPPRPPAARTLLPQPGPSNPPAPPGAAPGRGPGRRDDPGFIAGQLGAANRDQAALEQAEWRVTQALEAAVVAYLEGVVLPSVRRARTGESS